MKLDAFANFIEPLQRRQNYIIWRRKKTWRILEIERERERKSKSKRNEPFRIFINCIFCHNICDCNSTWFVVRINHIKNFINFAFYDDILLQSRMWYHWIFNCCLLNLYQKSNFSIRSILSLDEEKELFIFFSDYSKFKVEIF